MRKTSPHPLPHRFLFRLLFSIRVALTLYFANHKRTPPKKTASYVSYVHRKIRFKIRSFSFEGAVAHLPVFVRAKKDPICLVHSGTQAELSVTESFFEIDSGYLLLSSSL